MDIAILGLYWKTPHSRLELVEAMGKMCKGFSLRVLDIFFVNDLDMARIQKRHMGCYGVTNTLSFSLDANNTSGSIVVSVDTARRESLLYGQNISGYYMALLSHSVAHILGYEHGVEMDDICRRLLENLNGGSIAGTNNNKIKE